MNLEKISIFGLGKLGLPFATILSKHFHVTAIDADNHKVESLRNGIIPFFEPQLDEYFETYKKNLDVQNFSDYDIEDFDVAIILVNTPSNENGEFSNIYINTVIDDLSKKLKNSAKDDFLIILSSTVMPQTHKILIEKIESISNRKLNEGFGIVYIPDLVALGSVIDDFQNPDLLILGESDKKYGNYSEIIYKKIIKNNCPIVKMSLIEAEITKVSLNAYITMKISFANFIGNVSEKFNCNPHNITKALGYDKRISPYYIKSGVSFGGTCFPRDTWAFIKMSEKIGLDAIHIKATQKINEDQNIILLNKLLNYKDKTIGVLGLSFKPNTSVTIESAGQYVYNKLKELNYNVFACDQLVKTDFDYDNIDEFLKTCDIIVIIHNNKKIIEQKTEVLKTKILINPWGIEI